MNRKEITQWCRPRLYRPRFYGNREPKVIIIGEEHYRLELRAEQEELISLVRPDFILHEFFEGKRYNPMTGEISFLPGCRYEQEEDILRNHMDAYLKEWADRYNAEAIGIDLSCLEMDWAIAKVLKKGIEREPTSQSPAVCRIREDKMAARIIEYSGRTDKQLIAIIGSSHMKPKAGIHPPLKKARVPYVCIRQR